MQSAIPQITLYAIDNGWIVTAGCLRLAFTDTNELGIELLKFLAQPEKVAGEYAEKYGRPTDLPGSVGSTEAMTEQRSYLRNSEVLRNVGPDEERLRHVKPPY